jgi:hypothetical protein
VNQFVIAEGEAYLGPSDESKHWLGNSRTFEQKISGQSQVRGIKILPGKSFLSPPDMMGTLHRVPQVCFGESSSLFL